MCKFFINLIPLKNTKMFTLISIIFLIQTVCKNEALSSPPLLGKRFPIDKNAEKKHGILLSSSEKQLYNNENLRQDLINESIHENEWFRGKWDSKYQQGYPIHSSSIMDTYDPSYRVLGGVKVYGGFSNPMLPSGIGSSDLYSTRDFGDRRSGIMHYGDRFSHNTIIGDQTKLLIPNDNAGNKCSLSCQPWEYLCPISCTCILNDERCDTIENCEHGEDEKDCTETSEDIAKKLTQECESTGMHVLCPKTYRCLAKDWLCDGDDDCGDYSDETHCGKRHNCTEDQFECQNGFCIQRSWMCDGENDCKDFSDETNCTQEPCTIEHFQCANGFCVSLSFRCDGEKDCTDGSDEVNCRRPIAICPEGEFKCHESMGGAGSPGGRCISQRFKCDGDNDCGDWSDEENCPNNPLSCSQDEFKCDDNSCIPKRWQCDGEQDCKGGADENNCPSSPQNKSKSCAPDEYTCNNGRCILKTWLCDSYADCLQGEDEKNCITKCDSGQLLCSVKNKINSTEICLPQKRICDGINDCINGEDEINCPEVKKCSSLWNCEQICITDHKGKNGCACRPGFVLHENKINCTDIDECQFVESGPVCSQKCENTFGSFKCSCENGYILRPDLRTCKALGGAVKLILANRRDIREVSLSNHRYNAIVKGLHNTIAVDYHYQKSLLFWSDISTDVIKKVYMNGTKVRDVIKWGLESPGGIAIDWIHDLLFWTDSGTKRVAVSDLSGNVRVVIASIELNKPRAISVYPGEALVFWTDWGPNPKIERCHMDGSKRSTIISSGVFWPNGLTIDYTGKRLYWADAKHHVIENCNFDGTARTKILNQFLPHPFALTIFEDTMYWTDWNTKSVSAANKITGKEYRTILEGLHFPMDIQSYHQTRQPVFRNRCMKDNHGLHGGCSHLCLPNSISRQCACPIGLSLTSDQKTCNKSSGNLLLVARKKGIWVRDSSSITGADIIVPLDGLKSVVALDWCSKFDYLYWSDVERGSISRAHLNGSDQQVIVQDNLVTPTGLAYDWVTDKLYWTDPSTNRIEVTTSNGKLRSLLVWQNLDKPRDIVVNPIDGLMFWSDWGARPMIERAGMDGSLRRVIVSENLLWPNGLAVDYSSNKLYFVDAGTKTLEYINFDGTGRNILIRNGLIHPFGIDVDQTKVYWTDWQTKSVQMVDKRTGENRRNIITNTSDLMDIQIFHRLRRHVQNPCSIKNGGCSHLCLLSSNGYSCSCPIGIRLMENMKTCQKEPSRYILLARRNDIRQISLDFNHLVDVVLPLQRISSAVSVDVDLRTGYIYWADSLNRCIMSSSLNGKHLHHVICESLNTVNGIAIDSVGGKIYWTDSGRRSIEVSDLKAQSRQVLIWKNIEIPSGITLHYEEGLLFWTDCGFNPKIEKSSMDGAERTAVITSNLGLPYGLALDRDKKRIYWTDAQAKHIDSSDYNGSNRVVIISGLMHPYGLTIGNDHIYWTDLESNTLHSIEKHKLTSHSILKSNMENLMDVVIIEKKKGLANDVCSNTNGGCSHLCLRSSKGFSCKCPIGLNMKSDSHKECDLLPKEYLLIALRSGIGRISLDTPDLLDIVLPISGVYGAVVLDYHFNFSKIFYADVNLDVIMFIDMLNTSNSHKIISTGINTPNGIAIDWISNNIYWSDTGTGVIEVARLNGSCRKTIIKENLNDPRALILYPKRGYLFWSDWGEPPRIERCLTDGTERKIIVNSNLGFPTGLSIDFESKRLYWADALQDKIEMCDFNGRRRSMVIPYVTHPFGVTIFESFIFWTDWYNKSVFRASKTGDPNIQEIRRGLKGALDIRAVSSKRQPYDWNPCAQDNGGCSHLCFFKGTSYSCGCPDEPDNKTCNLDPKFRITLPPEKTSDDYNDDNQELSVDKDSDFAETTTKIKIIIIASEIVSVLLIIVLIAIFVLVMKSRRKRTKQTSRGCRRSVLTFSNPNYNVSDGTPLETKTTIWKRLKSDRSKEKIYEERNLTVETTSSSVVIPSSSPVASSSAILTIPTIA